jgi:tRNA threonylcarbamoyladenosine biosynthesis protein TsaE
VSAGTGGGRERHSGSVAETEALGADLASHLEAGDVVALSGPLGAGKTRFVAGIARGLQCKARVRSPSFTLVNEYRGRLLLVHLDLYRLDTPAAEELGIEEQAERGVLVVEWGEKLPAALRARALAIDFEVTSESGRRIAARAPAGAQGARAAALLAAWEAGVGTRATARPGRSA